MRDRILRIVLLWFTGKVIDQLRRGYMSTGGKSMRPIGSKLGHPLLAERRPCLDPLCIRRWTELEEFVSDRRVQFYGPVLDIPALRILNPQNVRTGLIDP